MSAFPFLIPHSIWYDSFGEVLSEDDVDEDRDMIAGGFGSIDSFMVYASPPAAAAPDHAPCSR